MPRSTPEQSTARLETRIPTQIYDTMQRAARLQGLSLTAYLIATVGADAKRVVAEAEMLRLSREDQVRFAEALLEPPQPVDRLARAARRDAECVASK